MPVERGRPGFLEAPIGVGAASAIGIGVGLAYALWMLGWRFAVGGGSFWVVPHGLSGGQIDLFTAMSGYFWIAQDAWRWPLLHVAQAGGAAGVNAGLIDPVPIAALIAKVLRSATGQTFNLFAPWMFATYLLNAAGLAVLVHSLGARTLVAAVVAGGIGALAPVIHNRFGHVGHASHWVFLFALAASFSWRGGVRGTSPWPRGALLIGLAALAISINLYLYVMNAAVAAAFFLRAVTARRMPVWGGLAGVAATVAAGVVLVWAFGLFDSADLTSTSTPFGKYSMNLLSPVWPQSSGLFERTGVYALTRGSIGATAGQYEGFSYIGGGAVALLLLAMVRSPGWMLRTLRTEWPLTLALVALTVWAASNQVYLGPKLILSYPLPGWLLDSVLAWFRAAGRFVWPLAWTLAALAVAGGLRALPARTAAVVAVVALGLQWVDLSVLRHPIEAAVRGPVLTSFGSAEAAMRVQRAIAERGRVAVIPSLDCNDNGGGSFTSANTRAAAEVQFMAGRANASMPEIALARGHLTSCAWDRTADLREIMGDGVLVAVHDTRIDRTAEAAASLACVPFAAGVVCTQK